MKTLLAVKRFGTFSAAGEQIGLTQTAVSGHIRRLEVHFGVQLFDRTRRSAILNADGQRIVERANTLIDMFDSLTASDDGQDARPLRIGAISSVQSTLLVPVLKVFRERFPASRLQVRPGQSLQLFDALETGDLDLAVMIRPSVQLPATVQWTELVREPFILAVPPQTPLDDWRDLLHDLPFLRYDQSSYGGRMVTQFLTRENLAPREILEMDDLPALWAMVENGLGAAILPLTETNRAEASRVPWIEIGPNAPVRSIGIVRSQNPSAAVSHLVDCFIGVASDLATRA